MLMPKGTIYFSEICSDEANLYTNFIKCPIGKKHHPTGPKGFSPPVQMSCFALMVWTQGSIIKVSSPDGPSMRAKKKRREPRAVSPYRGAAAAITGAAVELLGVAGGAMPASPSGREMLM
jgi:hypothetical protein